jgi:surface protein
MDELVLEEQQKYDKLGFVKPLNKITEYKKDQKELVSKALDIANGDLLGSLKYIVSCLAHEGEHVEMVMVIHIPVIMIKNKKIVITLPIVTKNAEKDLEDKLGFYVAWGDGTITHNELTHFYEKTNGYEIRIFGLNISGFGNEVPDHFKTCLTQFISFGNLGHNFTSLQYAFSMCDNLWGIPSNIPCSVTDASYMFSRNFNFNLPINSWDTSNITNMTFMFYFCRNFDKPLDNWATHNVTNMSSMFSCCYSFDQPINSWVTHNVTNMSSMFYCCYSFNQPLNSWVTHNVTNMSSMFNCCHSFDQPLNSWVTNNVTNMMQMFADCIKFNQPLDLWDTSKVTNMSNMFRGSERFNQPLNSWATHNVTDMSAMFYYCYSFDQPLNKWDVSNVTDMLLMFHDCNYIHSLESWNLDKRIKKSDLLQ